MKGKVVVITGGSSGIGKACAEVFGLAGAKVVITGRDIEKLNKVSEELNGKGIEALAVVADASQEEAAAEMIRQTIDRFERLDIMICNAGISMRALFNDTDPSVIRKVMDINFFGAVYSIKYGLPHILKSKGSIVGLSSIAGYRGLPARSGYSASKFALNGFLESLRTELLYKGVHVLTACPGFTASNIRNAALAADGSAQGESPRDEQKMMSSEEVAKQIFRAVERRKRSLILTRQGRMTVLMNKFFPGLADKLVYKHMAKEKDSPFK